MSVKAGQAHHPVPASKIGHSRIAPRRHGGHKRSRIVELSTFRFLGALSPREHLPGKAPTAQLTRIDAADRLFSIPLTRITSVPECAVSSVGFLWGSGTVLSRSCGFLWGSPKPLTVKSDPTTRVPGYRDFRILLTAFRYPASPGRPARGVDSSLPTRRVTSMPSRELTTLRLSRYEPSTSRFHSVLEASRSTLTLVRPT